MENGSSHCVQLLRALAAGRLGEWQGLPTNCVKDDAEAAFGPSDAGPDGVASLNGSLAAFRRYPPTAGAPYGIQIWLRNNIIFAVEINSPRLPQPFTEVLGEPEVKERSRLGAVHSQWIYASHGLVLHVQNITDAVTRLYGFAPCSLEDFRQLQWARIEVERRPLRPKP